MLAGHVRLALTSILKAKHGQAMILLAMVCTSWTVVNQGTSGRSFADPCGRVHLEYIRTANRMACRWFVVSFKLDAFSVYKAPRTSMDTTLIHRSPSQKHS